MAHTLVLLRHGRSEWNAHRLFTGWVDVALSDAGSAQAVDCGRQLAEAGLRPDVVHTSLLRRAITTASLALDAADRCWIPARRSWRLNERHYGALQGRSKPAIREEYGEHQFLQWRRSYGGRPPPIREDAARLLRADARYADIDALPRSESLRDVLGRVTQHWRTSLVPDLRSGATVLVVAHSNSLRALVKHIDEMSDDDIVGLNIPTGMPLVYQLDDALRPIIPGGRYLDVERAAAAVGSVANEGRATSCFRV